MGKKELVKWHREHFFVREKKDNPKDEHPAFVFEQSSRYYKVIVITAHPTTHGKDNVELKHNIDPKRSDKSYAVPYRGPRRKSDFYPKKLKCYRIHKDDEVIIKQLKNRKKK